MQKLGLSQSFQQKLSPQQIQFIKLLQVPTAELESRIEEELEINPALEEGNDFPESGTDDASSDEYGNDDYDSDEAPAEKYDDVNLSDYLKQDDFGSYKLHGDGPGSDDDERESPLADGYTLIDSIMQQLGFMRFDDRELKIAEQLVGSIDADGYIRRELSSIVNDLAFSQNVETDENEIESILFKVQDCDPPGIAARDLQECLHLQLKRKEFLTSDIIHALQIIDDQFEEFTKKHYDKIQKKLSLTDEELKASINIITHLNPKPGSSATGDTISQYIIPDYILVNNNGKLELSLNSKNAPDLRVSPTYMEMFDSYEKSSKSDKKLKEAVTFVKQKLDSARWFIDAIKQRQQTLLRTMDAIVRAQYEFFLDGDESKLHPMILKDIAEEIGMDISTISRVASSKSVQTEFGLYPLKYFFSEGIHTDSGEDVSSREVKQILKELIDNEDKSKPLADDRLEKLLNEKGYNIARRTVAKYREQLELPVARLRKQL